MGKWWSRLWIFVVIAGLLAAPLTAHAANNSVQIGFVPKVLPTGQAFPITWSTAGSPGNIDIALMYDAGGTMKRWFFIARNIPASNRSYTWNVDPSFKVEQYKLKIQLSDSATGQEYSMSSQFSVTGLTFTSPTNGEKITFGAPYDIKWNVTGDPTLDMSIHIASPEGARMVLLGNPKTGDRSLRWASPSPTNGTSFRLEAYAGSPSKLIGASGYFTFATGSPTGSTSTPGGTTGTVPGGTPGSSGASGSAQIGFVPTIIPAGSTFPIKWTPSGITGNVDIALVNGTTLQRWYFIARNVPVSSGKYDWTLSALFAEQTYHLKIQLTDPATGKVYGTSSGFSITGVLFDAPKANEKIMVDVPYRIQWKATGDQTIPMKIHIVNAQGERMVLGGSAKTGDWSMTWPKPAPTQGTSFRLEAFGGSPSQLLGATGYFSFIIPNLTIRIPVSSSASGSSIVAGKQYSIPYVSDLPTSNFKIEIVDSADQVVETVTSSTPITPSTAGQYNYWTPSASHPASFYGKNYKVRMTNLGTSQDVRVRHSPAFTIVKQSSSGSTGTTGSTGSPGSSGTVSGSTTVTQTPGGPSGTPGSTASTMHVIQQDTTYYYNPGHSARFAKGSPVWIDKQGFITRGMVADNENLEYRPGKTLCVKKHTQVEFKGGYIMYGRPALSYVSLEYAPGKSASFDGDTQVNFENGYAKSGKLNTSTQFEYGPGRKATFAGGRWIEFVNGFVRMAAMPTNTPLKYRDNKTVTINGYYGATFSGGLLEWGILAYEETLEYMPGKTIRAAANGVTFANGYLKRGVLAADTSLLIAAGKYQVFKKGVCVQFDSSGYASYGQSTTIIIK